MADQDRMGAGPTGEMLEMPATNGVKQAIERELIRMSAQSAAQPERPAPSAFPKFSQVSHVQEAAARAMLEELPVDEELERQIQMFAQRLTMAKEPAAIS